MKDKANARGAAGPSAQDFVLSKDPARAMQEMMNTIDRLRTIVTEETEALKRADTKAFVNLQERKLAAAKDYQAGAAEIMRRRQEFQKAGPHLKAELEKKQKAFTEAANKNLVAIERMRKAMKRLSDRIMGIAREAAADRSRVSYTARAGINSVSQKSFSMGINESA